MRITILGSTGSVGTNTLDVIARHPERYEVFALTAASKVEALAKQCIRFSPRYAVLPDPRLAQALRSRLAESGCRTEVLSGEGALDEVATAPEVDAVMAAIVGVAGLRSSLAAARAGKRLLLANKEALVVAGALFMRAVEHGRATLLTVDSEHSAILQCLPQDRKTWGERIEKLILTASGGPFRTRALSTFSEITPDEACAHPNWVMGRKISVDSATMMNKALEVIEAHWLFGVPAGRIEVVIHPQSVVHSMVQYGDGSVLAQLGTPDMRVPISVGLAWPDRVESGSQRLDFSHLSALTFEAPDLHRFPCLALAWSALAAPVGTTAVLNAANEVAVAAFLQGTLAFDRIHGVVVDTLSSVQFSPVHDLPTLMALDASARQTATALAARHALAV